MFVLFENRKFGGTLLGYASGNEIFTFTWCEPIFAETPHILCLASSCEKIRSSHQVYSYQHKENLCKIVINHGSLPMTCSLRWMEGYVEHLRKQR